MNCEYEDENGCYHCRCRACFWFYPLLKEVVRLCGNVRKKDIRRINDE